MQQWWRNLPENGSKWRQQVYSTNPWYNQQDKKDQFEMQKENWED